MPRHLARTSAHLALIVTWFSLSAMAAEVPATVTKDRTTIAAHNAAVEPRALQSGVTRLAENTNTGDTAIAPTSEPISSIAESLNIRFQGYPDISGTFRLNEDETISIPGLGRLSVAAQTAADLETALTDKAFSVTGKRIPVAVEVASYRSVFVTGDVRSPGPVPWFRGLTVLKAMAAAGGVYRSSAVPVNLDEGTKLMMLKLALALARHARLKAELASQDSIEVPERLIGLFGNERGREFIAMEQTLLGNRNGSRAASLRAITAGITASQVEIDRLNDLEGKLSTRLKRVGDSVDELSEAYKRRVVSRQRLLDSEGVLAELDEKAAGTRVQMARAISSVQELEREKVKLEESHRAALSEQLATTWADIEQFQVQVDGLRKATFQDAKPANVEPQYEIIRRSAKFSGQEFDELRPGDTLIIKKTGDDKGREVPELDMPGAGDGSDKPRSSLQPDGKQPRS